MGILGSLGHVSLLIDMKPLMHLWIPGWKKTRFVGNIQTFASISFCSA
jgi:hypothetical protein